MDPLFENNITVDKPVLEEWFKYEFRAAGALFYLYYGLLILLCAVCAVFSVITSLRVGLSPWLMWGALALFVGLAAFVLLNMLTHHKRYVASVLRKDKGKEYPQHLRLQFYEDELVLQVLTEDCAQAKKTEERLQEAGVLQREFFDMLEKAGQVKSDDTDAMAGLRDELQDLQGRMQRLNMEVTGVKGEVRRPYSQLTGYLRSPNLAVLYFEDAGAPVALDGFSKGSKEDFFALMRKLLQQRAAETDDARLRKSLHRTIEQYF